MNPLLRCKTRIRTSYSRRPTFTGSMTVIFCSSRQSGATAAGTSAPGLHPTSQGRGRRSQIPRQSPLLGPATSLSAVQPGPRISATGRCSATAPTRPSPSALVICATSIKALIPMLVGATTVFPGVLPSSHRRTRHAERCGHGEVIRETQWRFRDLILTGIRSVRFLRFEI